MTIYTDLKPGLYRARWLNGIVRHGRTFHKFDVLGVGVVLIPDVWINRGLPQLNTDCNAQLLLRFGKSVERIARCNGRPFVVRDVTVSEVPA